jgi:di/tricarboxylate transporter
MDMNDSTSILPGVAVAMPRPWMKPVVVSGCSALLGVLLARLGFSPRQALGGAIVAFAMASWASGALPEMTTGLTFFALATLGRVAEPKIILVGFTSSSFWLVLGGMVVAQAMTRTGLGRRMASWIAAPLATSYPRLILGVILISYVLAFVMPSNIGRIVLLMPIMLSIADQMGLVEGRRGRTGVVLATGFATFILSTTILPSNVPNLIMAGSAEAIYGLHLSYIDYLVLHAPVLGVVKAAMLATLICVMFPDKIAASRRPEAVLALPPLSAAERRLAVLLVATLVFWLTEPWHGIAPAWIGLAAAVVCLLPGIGMLPPDAFNAINHRTTLYVAALLGVVTVLSETGLGAAFGKIVLAALPLRPAADAWNFGWLALLSFSISLVASANAVGAIYTPLAADLARATGLPLSSVLMIQVLGFSTIAFAYQAPPIMVALSLGNVQASQATQLGIAMTVAAFLIIVPLDYGWWRLIGAL